jgi:hypothetical protein
MFKPYRNRCYKRADGRLRRVRSQLARRQRRVIAIGQYSFRKLSNQALKVWQSLSNASGAPAPTVPQRSRWFAGRFLTDLRQTMTPFCR